MYITRATGEAAAIVGKNNPGPAEKSLRKSLRTPKILPVKTRHTACAVALRSMESEDESAPVAFAPGQIFLADGSRFPSGFTYRSLLPLPGRWPRGGHLASL